MSYLMPNYSFFFFKHVSQANILQENIIVFKQIVRESLVDKFCFTGIDFGDGLVW